MIADCAHCRAEGSRACDECGNVVFARQVGLDPAGRDLCAYCLLDAGIDPGGIKTGWGIELPAGLEL